MEEKNRDFKGVWIPKEIYLLEGLSWTEKILLVEIDSLDNSGGCYASNEYFAKFLGKSSNQISVSIAKLKKLGLIVDLSFDGRKRYISVKADYGKTQRQTMGKPKGRVWENPKAETPTNTDSTAILSPEKPVNERPNNISNNTYNLPALRRRKSFSYSEANSSKEKTMQKYNESDPSDSYEPTIDAETRESTNPADPPKKNGKVSLLEVVRWAEKRRGRSFLNMGKQFNALSIMKKAKMHPNAIANRWIEMESNYFWSTKGFDFRDVLNSFDKKA